MPELTLDAKTASRIANNAPLESAGLPDGAVEQGTIMSEVLARFEYEESRRIEEFLNAHPKVLHILNQAVPQIEGQFGRDVPLSLDIYRDDNEPALWVFIVVDMDVEEARRKLNEFRGSWWNVQRQQIPDMLYFDLEFA